MSYKYIDIKYIEQSVEVTLNHPERRNPLSVEMIAELTAACQEIEASDALGVIIGAAGSVFCAGHDFKDMLGQSLGPMRTLMQACSTLMQLIHRLPQPVIAKVQGPAIGAGCQLALTCDLVVAAKEAWFRTPGSSGGWYCFTPMVALTRALGQKRALEMLMTGDPIMADQAAEWGMINRAVSSDLLEAETKDLLARVTRGSPLVNGIGKHAFYRQISLDEAQAYDYAAELMAATGTMADPQERMRAFVER